MSSAVPVPDVAQLLIRSEVEGKAVELCLWFRAVHPPVTLSSLTTIANRVAGQWRDNFSSGLAGPHLLKEVVAIDRSPGSSLVVTNTLNVERGFLGPSEAGSIALGLLNLTDEDVRGHFSRSNIYSIPQSRVTGNVVDSSYANGRLALWSTNNQSHGPFGWHHVYVSLFSGGLPRSEGISLRVTHYAIASLVVSPRRLRLTGRPS